MEQKKITYASKEMIRFLDYRGQRFGTTKMKIKDVVTLPGYIDFLASRLEEYDPGAERSHKMANRYRNKS